MWPALIVVAGSLLLLVLPLPPAVQTPLRAAWIVALAALAAWQVGRLVLAQRHLVAAWLRLPSHRAPATYVRALFDAYADRYDTHLLRDLHYAAPNLVRTIVGDRLEGRPDCRIADLGCGTGLCGPLFRRITARLVGVDLSPGMLREARRRGIYDELVEDEVVRFLGRHRATFDLLIAADVLVYVGDLEPVFRAAAAAMRDDALMAATVEEEPGDGFSLHASGRFAHGEAYLRRVADAAGLRVLDMRRAPIRREAGEPVAGLVVLLARPPVIGRAQPSQETAAHAMAGPS